MRLGPHFMMPVDHNLEIEGFPRLRVPLGLVSSFEGVEYVKWTENEDGTYTLTLFDKHIDQIE